MLYRGRNRDYSFYLRPVFDISFVLVWLFRLRVKSDRRHISLLAMIPKIPGGGWLRGSVRTGQACSDTHPKLSASQQQPTVQGASRGWGGGKKISYCWTYFSSVKMPLPFPNPQKLLSSTTSSGKDFHRLHSWQSSTSFHFQPAICQFQVMSPIHFWKR